MALSSAYWERAYGIGSFDEFFSVVEPFLPSQVGMFVYLKDEQIARLAYESPGGALGIALSALVAAVHVDQEPAPRVRDRALRTYSQLHEGESFAMPALVIPGVARVAIEAAVGGQPVVNVVGVRLGEGGTVQAAVNAVKAAWEGMGSPSSLLSDQYKVTGYKGTDLSTADGALAEAAGGQAGSFTTHISTAGAALLVKFHGGTRSRSGNGRMYLGPITEDKIGADGRTIDPTFAATAATNIGNFRSKLTTAGFPLVVISATKSIATNVVSHTVDSRVATQRRRIR